MTAVQRTERQRPPGSKPEAPATAAETSGVNFGPGTELPGHLHPVARAVGHSRPTDISVHTEAPAAAALRDRDARALTFGNQIALRPGDVHERRTTTRAIVAHELAHAAQQQHAAARAPSQPLATTPVASSPGTDVRAERDADRAAVHAMGLRLRDGPDATSSSGRGVSARRRSGLALRACEPGMEERQVDQLLLQLDAQAGEGRFDRRPPTAIEATVDSFAGQDSMLTFLNANMEQLVALEATAAEHVPEAITDREAYEPLVERVLRMTALGLMASHKVSLENKRDDMFDDDADVRVQPLLDAAANVVRLEDVKEQLEEHASDLRSLQNRAIFRRGDLSENLNDLGRACRELMPDAERRGLIERYQLAASSGRRSDRWNFLWGNAGLMAEKRTEQANAVMAALSMLYQAFPVFSVLDAEDVAEWDPETTSQLGMRAERAYLDVLINVDDVIRDIHSGDKDPLDMPEVIRVTRAQLPGVLQPVLDDMVTGHQQWLFWRDMGLTAAEILIAFIPVIGPALALGVGVASLAIQGEEMMDRMESAGVSADPYGSNPLGVRGPSSFESAMYGVSAVLTLVGAGPLVAELRGGSRALTAIDDVASGAARHADELAQIGARSVDEVAETGARNVDAAASGGRGVDGTTEAAEHVDDAAGAVARTGDDATETGARNVDGYDDAGLADEVRSVGPDARVRAAPGGRIWMCASPCSELRFRFEFEIGGNPVHGRRLDDLEDALRRAEAAGDATAARTVMDEVRDFAQTLRQERIARDPLSEAPVHYTYRRVSLDSADPDHWNPRNLEGWIARSTLPHHTVMEFDNGLRVWRDRAGDIIHEFDAGPSTRRMHTENQQLSAGAARDDVLVADPTADTTGLPGNRTEAVRYERAHSAGQGTGPESPYGIFDAPRVVNQDLQNHGIETLIRRLRDACGPGETLRVRIRTRPHSGTSRLARVDYELDLLTNGTAHELGAYGIRISASEAHPLVTAEALDVLAADPAAHALLGRVQMPNVLQTNFTHQH